MGGDVILLPLLLHIFQGHILAKGRLISPDQTEGPGQLQVAKGPDLELRWVENAGSGDCCTHQDPSRCRSLVIFGYFWMLFKIWIVDDFWMLFDICHNGTLDSIQPVGVGKPLCHPP